MKWTYFYLLPILSIHIICGCVLSVFSQETVAIIGDDNLSIITAEYDPRPSGGGAIFLLGRSAGLPFLSRIDPTTFEIQWTTVITNLPSNVRINSMALGINNTDVLIASNVENQRGLTIVRINENGQLVNSHTFEMPQRFRMSGISASTDRYIVHTSRRLFSMAFDDNYNQFWVKSYNGVPGYDQLHDSNANGKGGIFMYRNNGANSSPILLEKDQNGNISHQVTLNFNDHLYSQIQYVTYDDQDNIIILGFRNNDGAGNSPTGSQSNYTGILLSYNPTNLTINWQREIALESGPYNANGWRGQLSFEENNLIAAIASNTHQNNATDNILILEINPMTGDLMRSFESNYPTNPKPQMIRTENGMVLLDNIVSTESGIILQQFSDIENSCLFETADISLTPDNYVQLGKPMVSDAPNSATGQPATTEIQPLILRENDPCCIQRTIFEEVEVCEGEEFEGIIINSDTVLIELQEVSFNCYDRIETTIIVIRAPDIDIGMPDNGCAFDSARIEILNPQDYSQIIWSTASNENAIWVFDEGIYSVEATDHRGCRINREFEIDISTPITMDSISISIQTDPTHPDGSIYVMATGGTEPLHYQWDNGSTGQHLSGVTGGLYCLSITDQSGCQITECFEIDAEFPLIKYEVSLADVRCYGDSSASFSLRIDDGVPPFRLRFFPVNSDTLNYTLTQVGQEVFLGDLYAGIYELEITDSIGQSRWLEVQIDQPPPLNLEIESFQQPNCHGEETGSIELHPEGGSPPYDLNWTVDGNEIQSKDFIQNNISAGLYTFHLLDDNGCTYGPDTFVLLQPEPLIPEWEISNPLCDDSRDGWLEITELEGGTKPYVVSLGNALLDQPPFYFPNLSADTYSLIAEDARGCQYVDSIQLEFEEDYNLEIEAQSPIELGDTTPVLAFTNMVQIANFSWHPADFLKFDPFSPLMARAFPLETTTFFLEVINEVGCSASASLTIEVIPSPENVFIPNVFSPNQDGVNDGLTVFAGKDVAEIRYLKIFDRWGAKVWERYHFQPNQADKGWNGYFNGEKVTPGVFVYQAEILFKNGSLRHFQGDLLVLE